MVKIQNFRTTASPFVGIFTVNYYFNKLGLSQLIDNELGIRREKMDNIF